MRDAPALDPRRRRDIMAEVAAHAAEYTPEWRYEGDRDDPGNALAELFGDMFYETVDRLNSVPKKLYARFLDMTGFRMPDPASATGLMSFTAHETVTEPVPVPQGTQVFAEGPDGENIIYETARRIEATSAGIGDIYFADPGAGVIQRLDMSRRNTFFADTGGENLRCHRLSFGQDSVLNLRGPFVVEVELRGADYGDMTAAERLADPSRGRWTVGDGNREMPFDSAVARGGIIELTYLGNESFMASGGSRPTVTYRSASPEEELTVEGIRLKSRPMGPLAVESVANGDIELDLETGGYCLGRRPAAYSTCYLRSDSAFSKIGAVAELELDIEPVITEAPAAGTPQYQFNQRIIDKKDAVVVVSDDVYVAQVAWEYYNGSGWRRLDVAGDKNPFSCKGDGRYELTFVVPEDLRPVEVNAREGYYIRARVIYVENELSPTPRRIVPFLKSAGCGWSYRAGVPVQWCETENNGDTAMLEGISDVTDLGLTALTGLEGHPAAMYFRFDGSPHAMPLSLYFNVAGRARLEDKLRVEAWTGEKFEPVRWVDMTRNLLHSGAMMLYLPEPLPERRLFGAEGRWIRLLRSSYTPDRGGLPVVTDVKLNIVEAIQHERAVTEVFSTDGPEPGKTVTLHRTPVRDARVWVDEVTELPVAEARLLNSRYPEDTRLEWDDMVLVHCWVRWKRVSSLALCGPADRCFELDPYSGRITFGDGVYGRVPPAGADVIAVTYNRGGGARGNVPAGAVVNSVGSLPRISGLVNITPMSGGTDRFPLEKAEIIGNRRLKNRDRAAGVRDFEEIVTLAFPEARHVRCFSGRDGQGAPAPGHVTVVVEGSDPDREGALDDLCSRVYEHLARRCDCVMIAGGRLHVVSSTILTVSSRVQVEMRDPDLGAATQQEIAQELTRLINDRWRRRDIGDQLRVDEIWLTVRDVENVNQVRNIILEGSCHVDGAEKVMTLEDDKVIPYATVKSGEHIIQIM